MQRKNKYSQARSRFAGFTLLELLVVLVIIGLLAGYVGPRFFSHIGKSESKAAQAQIVSLGKALDAFRLDTGRYPTTDEGLKALMEAPPSISGWTGPYLQKQVPNDPWGRAYIYRSPGQQNEYDLFSLGKDGVEDGSAENKNSER